MKRYLVWHIDKIRADDGSQGPRFYADHDYTPGEVRLHARLAPAGGDLKVDIRVDGVSIFTSNFATLNKGATLEENAEDYPEATPAIDVESVVSFHVIAAGDAEDVTCELEIESLNDEDDESSN